MVVGTAEDERIAGLKNWGEALLLRNCIAIVKVLALGGSSLPAPWRHYASNDSLRIEEPRDSDAPI